MSTRSTDRLPDQEPDDDAVVRPPDARPSASPGPDALHRHARREVEGLRWVDQTTTGAHARRASAGHRRAVPRPAQRDADRARPEGARPRHRPHLRCNQPRPADRLPCPGPRLAGRARPLCLRFGIGIPAVVHPRRRRTAHDVPAAFRRRSQDPPHAAELHRQSAARRPAEPGHQRHRQHLAEPAADAQPGADIGADAGRGTGDDVRDLAPPGGRDIDHDPCVAADHPLRDRPLEEALRRPVASHRHLERPDRRGVHRTCTGEGVRSPARRRRALPCQERRAVHRQLRGPVLLRNHPAGDDVPRQPQLRRHRRDRRTAGFIRGDEPRRRAGVHPVLPPVHPAADPTGVDGQRAAIGHRLGGAGVRTARCAGTERRPAGGDDPTLSGAAGSSSSTWPFPTTRTTR